MVLSDQADDAGGGGDNRSAWWSADGGGDDTLGGVRAGQGEAIRLLCLFDLDSDPDPDPLSALDKDMVVLDRATEGKVVFGGATTTLDVCGGGATRAVDLRNRCSFDRRLCDLPAVPSPDDVGDIGDTTADSDVTDVGRVDSGDAADAGDVGDVGVVGSVELGVADVSGSLML